MNFIFLDFPYSSFDVVGQAGFLKEQRNTLDIAIPSKLKHEVLEREKTIFSINKTLSRKFIYGY